jgi:outer membrane biosynthesis protein TonB
MANLIQNLTSISRAGPSPGRRLLALALCAMLVLGSTFPGFALAGEADSEGEGTAAPIEVPVGPPDFDPGGEETGLEEEAPAAAEEGGAVEAEAEVEIEAPAPEEVTDVATEEPIEAAPPPPAAAPEPTTSAPEPEPVQQQVSAPSEPVANQSITAPTEKRVERRSASESTASSEAAPPAEPAPQEAPPPSPQPVASTPPDSGRSLAGRNTYVVQPGDCLWHIAAGLLPGDASTEAIAGKVARLWRLNQARIGTGDPNLIYPGTELRLR